MSDDIRNKEAARGGEDPGRSDAMPKDHELYTPQGGGGGTGSGSIQEVPAVREAPVSMSKGDSTGDVAKPGAVTLPQVGPRPVGDQGEEANAGSRGGAPERKEASSLRLLLTLTIAGALAGAVLVFVFQWSQPRILAYRAQVLGGAIQEVLKSPERYETVFLLSDSTLTVQLPEGVDSLDASQVLDKVYLGYDGSGEPVGFAVEGGEPGFQDIIRLIFGYNPHTRQVLGMKVLGHLETPGLGDKIVKDTVFVGAFDGVLAPIDGVKPDRNTGDPSQVDMITGATISSRAVIAIINNRIVALGDLLAAYQPPGSNPTGSSTEGSAGGTLSDGSPPSATNGTGQEERP